MTSPEPLEPKTLTTPAFGDLVENGWTSEDNPTRLGMFVREVRRTGRMNPGRWWEITDGKGKFWQLQPTGEHRLTVTARSEAKPIVGEGNQVVSSSVAGRDARIEASPDRPSGAHKVMTWEEYADLNIQGWHEVNRDETGAVHLRYLPQPPAGSSLSGAQRSELSSQATDESLSPQQALPSGGRETP
jgi:hypothetical protein